MFGAIFGHLSAVYQNKFEGEDEKAKVALYDPSGHKSSNFWEYVFGAWSP